MKSTTDFIWKMNEIKKRINDDISNELFEARFQYLLFRDLDRLREECISVAKKNSQIYIIPELDSICKERAIAGIVIFGVGINGTYTYQVIENSKYSNVPIMFCDNNSNLWGKEHLGRRIISPHELENDYRDYICVIGSNRYLYGIWNQLLIEEFPRNNILYPSKGVIDGVSGWQYFDFFSPEKSECFLDGGVYDGVTSEDFVKWTNNDYSAVYGFEANPRCIDKCKKVYEKKLKNAYLYELCLWEKKTNLKFSNWYASASKVTIEGDISVNADSIDNVLGGNRVSFMKMDIEGSELMALIGAEKTIKDYRPRMAISIYHKPWDIIEIPAKILEYDDSYSFAIRQYSSIGDETVLYAY